MEQNQFNDGGLLQIIITGVMIVTLWLLFIIPRSGKLKCNQKEIGNLNKGDRVIIPGGIYGTIVGFKQNHLVVKVTDRLNIELRRSLAQSIMSQE